MRLSSNFLSKLLISSAPIVSFTDLNKALLCKKYDFACSYRSCAEATSPKPRNAQALQIGSSA